MWETLARRRRGGELAPEPDEEAFEREPGLHLELEGAPGLAHRLSCPLGRERSLGDAVLGKLGEPVGIDERALGARRRDNEIAVPARENVERIEDLLALRSPGGAADPLLVLPLGLVARGGRLGLCASLGRAGLRELPDPARCRGRIEGGIPIDRARELDQDRPTLPGLLVQEAVGAVAPPARKPRERIELLAAFSTGGEV